MPNYQLERPADLGKLVTVGGPGATGSSTIAKILAKRWQLHRVDAGEMMRNNAAMQNSTTPVNTNQLPKNKNKSPKNPLKDADEFEKYLENHVTDHPEIDKKIDRFLVRMSYYPNMLIEGKFFAAIATTVGIPCTIKIWITADMHNRVMHVLERDGFLQNNKKITKDADIYKEIKKDLIERQTNDNQRCKNLYHQDLSKPEEFNDLIIDTSGLDVASTIKQLFKKIKENDRLNQQFPPQYLTY
jgi:cytidylate kinase